MTKWMFDRPEAIVAQVGLTCMNALPDPETGDWYAWTWFVTERISSKHPPKVDGTLHKEAVHEPRIPLTKDDEAWARELGRRIEEDREADDDEAA